ncbi:unnamed protein product, partial [Urochloa humidicola]
MDRYADWCRHSSGQDKEKGPSMHLADVAAQGCQVTSALQAATPKETNDDLFHLPGSWLDLHVCGASPSPAQ